MNEGTQHGGAGIRPHEEYEDDFEKDLDWLIDEEARSSDQEQGYEDMEAQMDKELEEEKGRKRLEQDEQQTEGEGEGQQGMEEERWPSPMAPLEGVPAPDGDACDEAPPLPPPPSPPTPTEEEDADKEKKYILEKIEEANRQLQDQTPPDQTRRRRLQFKDTLVDLVVPPRDYERDAVPEKDAEDQDVSGRLSELQISPRGEARVGGVREGRVLVEKDGKFDLVSLREVESQGLLPPLAPPHSEAPAPSPSPSPCLHSPRSGSSPRLGSASTASVTVERAPKPPASPRNRPNSAGPLQAAGRRRTSRRRVQSANNTWSFATFTLSPEQKELQAKLQRRRERLQREEEERQRTQEEHKRQQNERAFQAWLLRKREQLQEERRLQRAQEMESKSCKREPSDPQEAFKLWLQRKQQQQEKQRHLETLKRLEEESGYFLRDREECDRAFRGWLKRKQAEKRAEKRAARERSRRMVMEARRARRMQDLLCSVNDPRTLRLTDHRGYRF